MTNEQKCNIGVIGLGVMGASLAKNMINHGFCTALYSVSDQERKRFESGKNNYRIFGSIKEFISSLERPRKVFLMITAGKPVDMVIASLLPLLDRGDIIMDGGNSFYKDTAVRCSECAKHGILYMGIGISGGEKGALYGPSIMAGGSPQAWECVRAILEAIAARHQGKACCGYIAEGGAGHYVKMVHNGIEYAVLELIAETYQYMRFVKKMGAGEIRSVFEQWNEGPLNSYLIEISAKVLGKKEEDGGCLIDKILDVAEQKGTGKWTVAESVERGIYIPSIYEAQMARIFSTKKEERTYGAAHLKYSSNEAPGLRTEEMEKALLLSMILAYSQGFELISKAAEEENWNIDLAGLAAVWKDGCIIRSALLGRIEQAEELSGKPLILSAAFSDIGTLEGSLRKMAAAAVLSGMPLPCIQASLQYYDYYRSDQMPVNFIQALRDYFGAHTYMRCDREGHFHTEWE